MLEKYVGQFDKNGFWADIGQAWTRQPPNDDESIRNYIRKRGLRFIVQTKRVVSLARVMESVRAAWGTPSEDLTPTISRLFQVEGEEATPEHLAVFNLVTIEGVDVDQLALSPYDACYALMLDSEIASVEPDLPYLGFFTPDLFPGGTSGPPPPPDKAWALRNMRVDAAWRIPPPPQGRAFGSGIRIAHLDTGWTNHDDLDQANFAATGIEDILDPLRNGSDPMTAFPGLNPGHGTRTGSVMMSRGGIGALDTTGPGAITGVAPEATYVPKRCIRSVMVIFSGDVAQAVWHSTRTGCHVVSMSLGGRPATALRVAIQDAIAKHLLVVAAAGNKVPFRKVVWPAAYPESIALAATTEKNVPWDLSSRGRAVDVSAPGHEVWVAEPTSAPSGINIGSGTSYATAHTAGVAALWLAFHDRQTMIRSLSPGVFLQEVFRAHLKNTARVPGGWDAKRFGAGIVDASELLSSHPSAAVPLGFAQSDRRSLWWIERFRWLTDGRQLRASLIDVGLARHFEHELHNLELEPNTSHVRGVYSAHIRSRMSKTLRSWLGV